MKFSSSFVSHRWVWRRTPYWRAKMALCRQAPTGYDVLKMATRGSARLLGRDDIGQLSEGKCADLFLIDSRRLELVGCDSDAASVHFQRLFTQRALISRYVLFQIGFLSSGSLSHY